MDESKKAAFTIPEVERWRAPPTLGELAAALALIGLTVAIGMALRGHLPASSLPLLFLLAVLVASVRYGFWVGIFSSLLAFFAENFFFIEPYFTFHVGQVSDWLTLATLLIAGATTGFLVGRLRDEADSARTRAHSLAVMGQFATEISQAFTASAVTSQLVDALVRLEGGSVLALEADGDQLKPVASALEAVMLTADDQEAAERAHRRSRTERPAASGWTGGRFTFRSLGQEFGVIGYTVPATSRHEFQHARETIIDQAILALKNLTLRREATEAQGQAQREALRAALLSSLSHDLRTPLATILGGISSLRELGQAMPPNARQDTLLAVEEEAERLSRYVSNLLHMTRLKAGIDLRLDWIDVADVVHGAIARARRSAPDRDIRIAISDQLPLIYSDAVLLEQALFNLIENALKFSPSDRSVTLALKAQSDCVTLAVTDRGPGIPVDEQKQVFDAFFRGANQRESGSGLGLAITRGIIQALSGTIWIESPVEHARGTCVSISLPITRGET